MSSLPIKSMDTGKLVTRGGDVSGLTKNQVVTISNMTSFQAKVSKVDAGKAEVEYVPVSGDFSTSVDVA